MTSRCAAITLGGAPCKGLKRPGNEYCPAHDPSRQEARKRSASKAGKSKPGREMLELKVRLETLAEDVLSGNVNRGNAAVASQVYNVLLRAISVELKIKETGELEAQVEELREMVSRDNAKQRRSTFSWGA